MSYDILRESVPTLKRRNGDMVISGPNNASIILGRDRRGPINSGYGDRAGAGAVHIVVGRKAEDPSLMDDEAALYISARCDPDDVLDIDHGSDERDVSTVIGVGDSIRLSARKDVKISVGSAWIHLKSDGTIILDGDIQLGEGASERLLKESFATWAATHIHPVPTPAGAFSGVATTPIPQTVYTPRVKSK